MVIWTRAFIANFSLRFWVKILSNQQPPHLFDSAFTYPNRSLTSSDSGDTIFNSEMPGPLLHKENTIRPSRRYRIDSRHHRKMFLVFGFPVALCGEEFPALRLGLSLALAEDVLNLRFTQKFKYILSPCRANYSHARKLLSIEPIIRYGVPRIPRKNFRPPCEIPIEIYTFLKRLNRCIRIS
jgi:hypothetical protein